MLTDSLKNKVALVTGAGRGIGKEIAKTLASCGAFVIVNYNSSPDAAEQTVKEIIKHGGMAAPVQCDVSDFDACGKMMEMIINNYGHLDILVNNAGVTRDGLIMKMSEEDFDRVLDTNLKGAFHTIRYASRYFLKQKSGKIINISSVSGVMDKRVNESPISLLKFFCVAHTFNLEATKAAIIFFVVVFPLDPVTATTGISNFIR